MARDGGHGAPGASTGARGRAWLTALVLVAAVAAVYANALSNGFVFDDRLLIVDHPGVRQPFAEFLQKPSYRPLRTLSYRLDYAIGGMEPWIFHASNVVYHAVAVLLVAATLQAAGASPGAAAAGALLFAVHPVQTDAVTYASGRRDLLCALFFVAGFLAFLAYRRRARAVWLAAAAAAYVLAILSKEMAVTLPLVCLAWARFARAEVGGASGAVRTAGTRPAPARVAGLAVLAVAGLVAFGLTYGRHVARVIARTPWHGGGIGENFATVARIWAHYLGLVVWPARLSADYSFDAFPVSTVALDPRALAAAALLAVLAVGAALAWRRRSLVGFGAAWWAITLLPVSHLIPYSELLAEHYLYLPMVGAAFVMAGAVDALVARFPERRLAVAGLVVLLAIAAGWRTVVRNQDWRDPMHLWAATAEAVPGCARARFNLGQAYFETARLEAAEREWRAAAAIRPQDPEIAVALATLYYRMANHEPAKMEVARALALKPGDPQIATLAGWIALDSGDPGSALTHFDAALAKLPPERSEGATLGRNRAELALGPGTQGIQRLGGRGATN